jgi:mRNA-degrading endonuclease RelE of RelBE toxin-antitoxin system
MSYEIIVTGPFEKKIKRLAKKYRSLRLDLAEVIDSLSQNPFQGTPLGKECYKIRVSITSKGKGKSGGARMITYIKVTAKTVYLVDIYDKSEKENISDKELKLLIELLAP